MFASLTNHTAVLETGDGARVPASQLCEGGCGGWITRRCGRRFCAACGDERARQRSLEKNRRYRREAKGTATGERA